jgi:hypothetical protein
MRKSFGMAYDYAQNRVILFGGINGRQVLGDTYESVLAGESDLGEVSDIQPGDAGEVTTIGLVRWNRVQITGPAPAPRWGHSMVYDDIAGKIVLFGGFDANNKPLNDLWDYDVAAQSWTEVTTFQEGQRPSPRGGASLVFFAGDSYKRGAGGEYASTKRNRLVLFGGTDGKNYYNDTWVFDRTFQNRILENQSTGNRWYIVDPGGEQSRGPSPRAFASMVYAQNGGLRPDPTGIGPYGLTPSGGKTAASASLLLFGGRTGTMPANSDTDRDLVDDGQEYELGGPAAGRDPRVNARINPNGFETLPFNFLRLGADPGQQFWLTRGFMSDFEVMSYNERVESRRLQLFTWQGWPIETTLTNQYYVIGDETLVPFEDPNTNRIIYVTGVDAMSPDWTNLWYNRYPLQLGNPNDSRNVWQLGIPDNRTIGVAGAPPYAYSGRWVYGTQLDGPYPNDAQMELYSPIFSLTLPNPSAANPTNPNSFFLVYHEWLDLADANDKVYVDLVRPSTPADVATRVSGQNRPTINIVPPRNNSANTTGSWRRVIVPLDVAGNESNLYFRFTLQSDSNNVAGGWYIDDVAVIQGMEIEGVVANAGIDVCLIGENFNNNYQQCTTSGEGGGFGFGLLPLGNYQIASLGVTNGPYVLSDTNIVLAFVSTNAVPPPVFGSMSYVPPPVTFSWNAETGIVYSVQFATNLFSGTWTELGVVTGGAGTNLIYTDPLGSFDRIYRVVVTNSP